MEPLRIVVAHSERITVRTADAFLKIDAAPERLEREARTMTVAPVPTATVLWQQPGVLALAPLVGQPLGRLGTPSNAAAAAWTATGRALRLLHDAAPPPWAGRTPAAVLSRLDDECRWLLEHDVLPAELVDAGRAAATAVVRPYTPCFTHGDLQPEHVLVDGDEVVGILDWSEGGSGDPVLDVARLTMAHPEHLAEVLAGYGRPVGDEVIRGWSALICLTNMRWLIEHGFDPHASGAEIDILRANV